MRQVRIGIEETLKYRREMTFEIPDDLTEVQLDKILDTAQRRADSASDIPYILENFNKDIQTIKGPNTDLDSPWSSEIEIDDLDFIK